MHSQISVQPDWFLLITIAVVALFGLATLYRLSRGKRCFSAWLLVPPIVVLGWYYGATQRIEAQLTDPAPSPTVQARDSTEEMWNRLTEARIDLGDEAASDTPSEAAGEAASAARPAWVDAGSTRVGGDVTEVVRSEPFTTVDECYAQLEHQFLVEAWRRMKTVVPENQKEMLAKTPVTELGIPLDYVMREICQEEYTETVDSSVGEMKRVYVLMKFTPQTDAHLLNIWQSQVREASLGLVGKIAALVVAGLGSLYGVLRIDTMTRGYYTKRLIAGASAAIIAIAAVLFVR